MISGKGKLIWIAIGVGGLLGGAAAMAPPGRKSVRAEGMVAAEASERRPARAPS